MTSNASRLQGVSRRRFLRSQISVALAAAAFPVIIPGSALGKNGFTAPSNRIGVGAIGVGPRGQDVLQGFLKDPRCQVIALCDVKRKVLTTAKAKVDSVYSNSDCQIVADFRALVERPDLDAILIASPDHWHVLHALAAVRAGKDVYVEKPLGLSLGQDQRLREEIRNRSRVFQFGTQQRSDRNFRCACELVRNGAIGRLNHINVWAPGSVAGGSTQRVAPPDDIDYESWLGPAPQREHTQDLTLNEHWWYTSDFALGFIAGWGIHPIDIALWGAGDLADGTVEVVGKGLFPSEGLHDTATSWHVDYTFESKLTMKFASTPSPGSPNEPLGRRWSERYGRIEGHGTAFEGSEGWILVHRGGLHTNPEGLIERDAGAFKTQLVRSSNHVGNFLEAVRSRAATVSSIEAAVKSDAFCHIADIAIREEKPIRYDGRSETIPGDSSGNDRLHHRPLRKPWTLG